jgi:hypothetical protein
MRYVELRTRVWYSILVYGRREPCVQDGTGGRISNVANLLEILEGLRCGGVGEMGDGVGKLDGCFGRHLAAEWGKLAFTDTSRLAPK